MTDSNLQRLNMVESQVRPSDVTDRRIIKAMLEVPREKFVPAALASMAYMDEPVPLAARNGSGIRYMLAPRTFAKLVQLAEIDPEAVVLDVGCAAGYSTAVLARLAKRVVAVELTRIWPSRRDGCWRNWASAMPLWSKAASLPGRRPRHRLMPLY